MRKLFFTGEMENVPPQPMLSPAELRLKRVALLDPAYRPLCEAVKPHLAEFIRSTEVACSAPPGGVSAALKGTNVGSEIQKFARDTGIHEESAALFLFGLWLGGGPSFSSVS